MTLKWNAFNENISAVARTRLLANPWKKNFVIQSVCGNNATCLCAVFTDRIQELLVIWLTRAISKNSFSFNLLSTFNIALYCWLLQTQADCQPIDFWQNSEKKNKTFKQIALLSGREWIFYDWIDFNSLWIEITQRSTLKKTSKMSKKIMFLSRKVMLKWRNIDKHLIDVSMSVGIKYEMRLNVSKRSNTYLANICIIYVFDWEYFIHFEDVARNFLLSTWNQCVWFSFCVDWFGVLKK